MNALPFAVLLGVALGIGAATGWALMLTIAYVLAGALVVAWVWSRFALARLDLHHRPRSDKVQVGETLLERLELRSGSPLPRPWIALLDHSTLPWRRRGRLFALGPGGSRAWTLATVCRRRGEYQLGPFELRGGDPFGCFSARRVLPGHHRVLVLPATHPIPELRLPSRELPGGDREPVAGPHSSAQAAWVRDYAPGDPLNRVHWRSTARTGRLIVKELEHEPTADVWIALDLDAAVQAGVGEESTEEYAVTAAASVARHFLELGRTVGLAAQGDRHLLVQPDRGERQLQHILEALATARAHGHTTFAELLRSDTLRPDRDAALIAITPSLDPGWPHALRHRRGARAAVVLVEPSTFGGRESSLHVVGELSALGVPTYMIKRGSPVPTR